jgi:hypothetical protein
LEKLNFLNNEKSRKITEIETLFEMKKSRPGGSKAFQQVSDDRAPNLQESYFISQSIKR